MAYYWRVRAVNASGPSLSSTFTNYVAPPPLPAPPSWYNQTNAVVVQYIGTSASIVSYGPTYRGQKQIARTMITNASGGITKLEVWSNLFPTKFQTNSNGVAVEIQHPR